MKGPKIIQHFEGEWTASADELVKRAALAVGNLSGLCNYRSLHPVITTLPRKCRLQCKVTRDLCTERTDVPILASAFGEEADGTKVEYVCPTVYGERGDISASFTSAEPGICKAVDGELCAAMAVLFPVLRSPRSRQADVSLHHTVVHVDVPLEI